MLLGASCNKGLESINIDPNHINGEKMEFNYLFTAAEVYTSGTDWDAWRNSLIYTSTMIQHLASTQSYWNGDKYTYNDGYNSAFWDRNYPNAVTNIVEVINAFKDDPENSNAYHIARILKAFIYHRMTDLYGDVPYSEAGLGYISKINYPKYDRQEDIYADLLKELKESAEGLDANKANTLGGADLIYAGNALSWRKFAYSLMLRLGMRMSKVDPARAQQWVETAVQGGLFAGNSENAIIKHDAVTNDAAEGNGKVLSFQDPNATRLSKTFVDYLKSKNDPRLIYLSTVATNPSIAWGSLGFDYGDTTYAKQLGMPNGYDELGGATDISKASNWPGDMNKYSIVNRYTFARVNAPTFLLTYSANQFLLAEAALRGWTTGNAADYYNAAIRAAMQQLNQAGANPGVSDSQINAYLAAHPFDATNALKQINTEYWVATFMDEYEAWANWRRTGYPELTPVRYFGNVTGGTIPRRFTYPVSEGTINGTNYMDAVSRMSDGDKMTSRVWWDK